MKCEYCNENESTIDLKNYFLVFSEKNIESGYNICESCFNTLNKNGVLKSRYGFKVMLMKIVGKDNMRYENGDVYIKCKRCGFEYIVHSNDGHILPDDAPEEEKRKWEWYFQCTKCNYKNLRFE